MARKSQFRDLTLKKGKYDFLVTVRIGVHRRMKVGGPAACTPAVSVTRLWLRFWIETFLKSQRRFSFFEEENYIGKAMKHFPTDEAKFNVNTSNASPSTLQQYLHTLDQEVGSRIYVLHFHFWFVFRMAANKWCLTFRNLLINNLFLKGFFISICRFLAWFTFLSYANDLYAPPILKSHC